MRVGVKEGIRDLGILLVFVFLSPECQRRRFIVRVSICPRVPEDVEFEEFL